MSPILSNNSLYFAPNIFNSAPYGNVDSMHTLKMPIMHMLPQGDNGP